MKSFRSLMMAATIAVVVAVVPAQVFAASNSLGVNPRRDYTIKPGETVKDTLVVTNLNKTENLILKISPVDFEASGETGSPALLLKRTEPTKWSLKPYISIPSDVTIPAGKSADIPVSITLPKNIGAGSYYSAIRYSTDRGITGDNVGLASSGVSLIFVRVPGDVKDSLTLQKFGTYVPNSDLTSGTYKKFFGSAKPKYISYTLKNTGNVADQPMGSIQINSFTGKQVKLIQNANPNKNVVLIDQTRRIDVCLQPGAGSKDDNTENSVVDLTKCEDLNLMPGRYTAKLDMLYGGNGTQNHEIRATATFWYLPAWFIISVVLGLLIIAGFIWSIVRGIRYGAKNSYRARR